MTTARVMRLSLATSIAMLVLGAAVARADDTPTRQIDQATQIRTAASIAVPAQRAAAAPMVAPRVVHRRKVAAWRRPLPAPASIIRVAYRPTPEMVCTGVCAAPVTLFIGILY